jgi:ornithine cyclodeaminase/alanine dehydrogenase-like protein (mu-crystallin family)
MKGTAAPGLLYIASQTVASLLPDIPTQIGLVREAYVALASGRAQVPATPLITPRPDGFLHAMPAYLADRDVVALKWIGGYEQNPGHGLAYLSGLIVINDSETGFPVAIIDCGEITAARTAAASGLCIVEFASTDWKTAAIIGYGVQARAHIAMLRNLNPEVEIVVSRKSIGRTDDEGVRFVPNPTEAAAGADIVITAIPLATKLDQLITPGRLKDNVLLLPIDYDSSIDKACVERASLFLVDDIPGFEGARSAGRFSGWPKPEGTVGGTVGQQLRAGSGTVVCCNLGVGALDAIFADVVHARARAEGVGEMLAR